MLRFLLRLGSVRLFGRAISVVALLVVLAALGFLAYTVVRIGGALR